MTKQEIRKKNLKIRYEFSDRDVKDEMILRNLTSSGFYANAKTIMTYISYKSEVDTKNLILKMINDGKRICTPVCFEGGLMDAFEFSGFENLVPSEMGILEPYKTKKVFPDEIDLIIVPGCAFNENGFRIGYGGGFYDRYLLKTRAVTCGLFYEALKTDFVPDKTDIPLDFIVTEKNIYSFKK